MDDFDRIEDEREQNEGLVYEEYWQSRIEADDLQEDAPDGEEH